MKFSQTKTLMCDVLVAGGGMAGVSAAIAAARSGARVILIQDRPVLGGNASSEVRMHAVGADGVLGKRSRAMAVEAREGGLIEEIRLEACVTNPQLSPSVFDLILYDKCRQEPNLTLLLNTSVTDAKVDGGLIRQVTAERPSTGHRFEIGGTIFLDCTGDGVLGFEAGAEFRHGREAASEFGETLAVAEADGKTLGSTLLFMARKHDRPMPFRAPAWARPFTEADLKWRPHASAGFDLGLEYGYWWIEWGGELDTIRDNEIIRDGLMEILLGVWDHIKNGGEHGASHWALDWCGFLPGKRESRRFVGLVTLTEKDILGSTAWEDAIGYGGWPIDTHPPGGVDAVDEPPCEQTDVPFLYDIPLRACVAKEIKNLLFAGRNISASHIAFASTRVMATCSVIGQGVGTAAALCVRHGLTPHQLVEDRHRLGDLQQALLRDDCFLIGVRHEGTADHARTASITASSAQPGAGPEEVISGITRCVDGQGGVAPDRATVGFHRWISQPELPAWLAFEWPHPVSIGSVQITFDTGLHRLLTFSLARGVNERMHWGRPAPETVKSYEIAVKTAAGWRTLVSEDDNYQRLRRHRWEEPVTTPSLRISVSETQGVPQARILEVRILS